MALALYRKYRPATFAEVVGQEHVTDPLRTALAAGRINHAYLFSGPRGCGKTSSARILARSLNCVQGPTPDPCGVCPSCTALAPEGPGSLDVVELDAASHGGVEDTRDLRDRAFYMPAESRYRVFIIDEAHMVSPQGFNALLKIVEEPPEHLVFIFATTEPDKVLTTIRSRTHHYPFRLIAPAVLRALLERLCAEEGVRVEPAVFPLVIQAGGGSARDSLSVLDQLLAGAGTEGVTYRNAVALLGVTDAALLDEMADALAAADGASVFGVVDKVVEAGHDPRRFAADLLQRMRDLVILGAVPDAAAKGLVDAPDDQLSLMAGQGKKLGIATSSRFAELLHTGLVEMRGTTSPRLVLELICARMLLPAASLSDGALLQRLERMERRMSIAGSESTQVSTSAPPVANQAPVAQPPPVVSPPPPVSPPPAAAPPSMTDTDMDAGSANKFRRRSQSSTGERPAVRSVAVADRTGADLGLPPPPRLSASRPAAEPTSGRRGEPAASGREREAVERDQDHPTRRDDSPQRDAGEHPRPPGPEQPAEQDHTAEQDHPAERDHPAGRSIATVEVTDVRRVWSEVLAVVQRQRRTTQILLASATVATVGGGALHLTMPTAGMARRVVEPANADLLRGALREVLGVDWIIRCEVADPSARVPSRVRTGPPGGPGGWPSGAAVSDLVPPPDEEEIPDDYGEEPDPAQSRVARDPEDAAIALLTSQLGAQRLQD